MSIFISNSLERRKGHCMRVYQQEAGRKKRIQAPNEMLKMFLQEAVGI